MRTALFIFAVLAASAQQVKFSSTSQLVVVNVSAKDKTGNPVANLQASDFTVTEDGRPQQIKVFEFQRLDDTPLAPAALAVREAASLPAAATNIAPAKP